MVIMNEFDSNWPVLYETTIEWLFATHPHVWLYMIIEEYND